MKRWLILLSLFLTACASAPRATVETRRADYPDMGAAPELIGDIWINTDVPLRLADLRGKVVLLDMWTFG
jgi:hypothetical protein